MIERLLTAARREPMNTTNNPRIISKGEYRVRIEVLNERLRTLVSILREVHSARLEAITRWHTVYELITRVKRQEGGEAMAAYIIELYVVVSLIIALEQHVDNTIEYSEIDYGMVSKIECDVPLL